MMKMVSYVVSAMQCNLSSAGGREEERVGGGVRREEGEGEEGENEERG